MGKALTASVLVFKGPAAPPSLALTLLEPLRGIIDALGVHTPAPARHPKGIIVYPGLGTNGFATHRLRAGLGASNHNVQDWGRGLNTGPLGDFDEWLRPLGRSVEKLADTTGEPVHLVGWSLGGVYARELAKLHPQAVAQVITLGTPHTALPLTNVGGLFELLNRRRCARGQSLTKRVARPPSVPLTSIYSRTDGVVAWQACRAKRAPLVKNVELNGLSHLGLVSSPRIIELVAGLIDTVPRNG